MFSHFSIWNWQQIRQCCIGIFTLSNICPWNFWKVSRSHYFNEFMMNLTIGWRSTNIHFSLDFCHGFRSWVFLTTLTIGIETICFWRILKWIWKLMFPSVRCEVLWVKMEEGNLGRGILFLLWSTYVQAWKGNRKGNFLLIMVYLCAGLEGNREGNLGCGIFFLFWSTYVWAWKGNRERN